MAGLFLWPLYRFVLMAALRDKILLSVLGIVVLIFSLAIFFGASVMVEQMQFVRTFAAFGARLFAVVSLSIFVISYLRRAFEARDVDFLLSRPISRAGFVLTHALAISTLAVIVALILGGSTLLLHTGNFHGGVSLWLVSLVVECVIMANVALFFAFVMSSSAACMLIVFGFYLLARLIGDVLGILYATAHSGVMMFLARAMEVISIFIPRLDLMGQSKWLLYGAPPELSFGFVVGQGAVFTALVVGAAMIDLQRRQF